MSAREARKEKGAPKPVRPAAPKGLTADQRAAVAAAGQNVLVTAGAGTGKTRVLVERFLHFVTVRHVPVTEILALTFTEKAANEMKSRIMKALADREDLRRDLESAYISTVHAFAARLLREHPLEAGVDPDFRVLESEEADFLKEQAADEAVESRCEKGNEIFELVKTYGETRIKDSLIGILNTARHDGKYLAEFFPAAAGWRRELENAAAVSALPLFEVLGEKELAREWLRFEAREDWDWRAVEDFRAWCKTFSGRRSKKGETHWKDIRSACEGFLARKIGLLAGPWTERFEDLALSFENIYEARKKERGFLDFDDLEIRAIRLFTKEAGANRRLREKYRQKFRQIMVDEFQDTNYVQLGLVELFSRGDNLFLVGDFKQSIYGFRGAEPRVFSDTDAAYRDAGRGARFSLADNFRTAAPVLAFINRFFRELWAEDGLEYQDLAARTEPVRGASVEWILVRPEEGESLAYARMREADHIAEKILELRDGGYDYGQIAVLFQAMTDAGLYEQALKKRNIPYFTLSGGGFYHQPEIRDMMSYLAFLDNPLADIPLAAALRSPLFQVRDNTLFWLSHCAKAADKEAPLYRGVKSFEGIAEIAAEEKDKIRFFCAVTDELLALKDRLRLTELLDLILARTGYELTVLADPQGVRRYANLKKIVNLAREFERYEPLALGSFLKTVRRLETQEARESEAQIEAEESGRVVRLCSIHRAKGLEFPVVFVADLAHQKRSAESRTVTAETGMGYALQVRNEATLEMEKPWTWKAVNERLNRKEKEEWKRLFYVAMTRARERLILSGVGKEKDREGKSYYEMPSWMDWLMAMPAACLEDVQTVEAGPAKPKRRKRSMAEKKDLRGLFARMLMPAAGGETDPALWKKIVKTRPEWELLEKQAGEILASAAEKERVPSRAIDLPVSAFASYCQSPDGYRRVYEIGYPGGREEGERPDALDREVEEVSAANFGTAVHRVLERLDFKNPCHRLEEILRESFRLLEGGALDQGKKIVGDFVRSPVFERLAGARAIKRELAFVLNGRHGLIHGVIDVLFQDPDGRWHVLDYKTAVGSAEAVREAAYDVQIKIYAYAVRQILGNPPGSGIVYFLKNAWAWEDVFDGKDLDLWGGRLDQIQSEILQFSQPAPPQVVSRP